VIRLSTSEEKFKEEGPPNGVKRLTGRGDKGEEGSNQSKTLRQSEAFPGGGTQMAELSVLKNRREEERRKPGTCLGNHEIKTIQGIEHAFRGSSAAWKR